MNDPRQLNVKFQGISINQAKIDALRDILSKYGRMTCKDGILILDLDADPTSYADADSCQDEHLESLGLEPRVYGILRREEIKTVSELCTMTRQALLRRDPGQAPRRQQLSNADVQTIEAALELRGLRLRQPRPELRLVHNSQSPATPPSAAS